MLRIEGAREVWIDAPPERVWELLTDVSKMAAWSPHVRSSTWVSPASGPAVGAAFRTTVRLPVVRQWTNTSTVYRCEPPSLFEFGVGDDADDPTTVWTYELEPREAGTQLTERWHMRREYRVVRAYFRLIGQRERLAAGVEQTLARIKQAAEAR